MLHFGCSPLLFFVLVLVWVSLDACGILFWSGILVGDRVNGGRVYSEGGAQARTRLGFG
jgi:hypothetical protein